MQRMVLGEVDDAEAAFADQLDDLELAQHRADRQRVLVQARRRRLGSRRADDLGPIVAGLLGHQRSHASLNQPLMSVAGRTLPAYLSMLGSSTQAWLPVQW